MNIFIFTIYIVNWISLKIKVFCCTGEIGNVLLISKEKKKRKQLKIVLWTPLSLTSPENLCFYGVTSAHAFLNSLMNEDIHPKSSWESRSAGSPNFTWKLGIKGIFHFSTSEGSEPCPGASGNSKCREKLNTFIIVNMNVKKERNKRWKEKGKRRKSKLWAVWNLQGTEIPNIPN